MTSKIYYFLLFIISSLGNMPFTSAMDPVPVISFSISIDGNSKNGVELLGIVNRIKNGVKKLGTLKNYPILISQEGDLKIEKTKLANNLSDEIDAVELYNKLGQILLKAYSPSYYWLWDVKFDISKLDKGSFKIIPKNDTSKVNLDKGEFSIMLSKVKLNKLAVAGIAGIIILVIGIGCYIVYKSVRQAPSVKKTQKKGAPKKSGKKRSAKV